jgi:hypothetical protein
MRPSEGATETSYRDGLVQLQKDIAEAKKVLVVGAGAVGLEMAGVSAVQITKPILDLLPPSSEGAGTKPTKARAGPMGLIGDGLTLGKSQEIREAHPDKPVTIVHSLSHVLNPTSSPQPNKDQPAYTAPTSLPKLSLALEKQLAQLNIDLVLNDRVVIPPPGTGSPASVEWDGNHGRTRGGIKRVRTTSGKIVEADFVFVSIGNRPNSGLVKDADAGAVKGGMIWVDEYLRVSAVKHRHTSSLQVDASTPRRYSLTHAHTHTRTQARTPAVPLTLTQVRSNKLNKYYAIGDCSTSPGWKTSQGAVYDAAGAAAK